MIHPRSAKLEHFLGLVDLFIELGQPEIYQIEPAISDEYQPDVYLRNPEPVIVEYQRTRITNKRMQDKVDAFVYSAQQKKHDARVLWIVSDYIYTVKAPPSFTIEYREPPAK